MAEQDPMHSHSSGTEQEENFEDAHDTNDQVLPEPPSHPTTANDGLEAPIRMTDNTEENVPEHLAAKDTRVKDVDIQTPTKPPSLPARSLSKASEGGMSNTQDIENTETQSNTTLTPSVDQPTTNKSSTRASRFQGFSASLPSVPWGAPPARRPSNNRLPSPNPTSPAPTQRKSTPFGWLSRATSTPKETRSSPPRPGQVANDTRRNTANSIETLNSNPDLTLKALEEAQDGKNGERVPAKQSLRAQFKLIRMRSEVGITILDEMEISNGDTRKSPVIDKVIPPASPLLQSPVVDQSVFLNPELASGTVSGISTAASDAAVPIDWDFWQSVVNEGPQAIARTSPEELTLAIAGGIPHTIRGVIWQVLASSKNEELETVYNELKLRGTKDEVKEHVPSISASSTQHDGRGKDSANSSRSSVHSGQSTPATSTHLGMASPSPSHETSDPISAARLQAQLATERAKKAKEDAAAVSKLEKMIRRDMGTRTSYAKYAAAAGFQDGLFNVCKAYALFDDAVGYPQGMNFIIMPLLFTMPEEEAFCLLVRLMNKYQLRELFINDMPGLHLHLYQFERLLEDLEPALFCHLNRRGVTPRLYATQWFLTLFAYRFPLQLVLRVFDLVLCEGLEGAILKFGMALVQRNVQTLLAMNDMQALTNYLKEKLFDVYIDSTPSSKSILESGFFGHSGGSDTEVYRADVLVQDACAIKLTPEMVGRYTAEYEEKTKAEKARDTELENLKTDSATKATQIRSLEQRAEKSDAEHIEIANELVKIKVENQDLLDENESLKGQVEELKKVAASEAAIVEERMRTGTEQVMQRNIEVQNENRHIEEQMVEMEKELVEMKMKYAELNGEHETLRQRWIDLRKVLDP